jgi:hypothetical protein
MLIAPAAFLRWFKPCWQNVVLAPVLTVVGIFCGIFLDWSRSCWGPPFDNSCGPDPSIETFLSYILLGPIVIIYDFTTPHSDRDVIRGLSSVVFNYGGWIVGLAYYYFLLSIPKVRVAITLAVGGGFAHLLYFLVYLRMGSP